MASQKSGAEKKLVADLEAAGYPPIVQHKFHEARKWALDLAYPDSRLAIEVDGRWHTDHKGKRLDQNKRNAALEMGWRVLSYPAREVVINKRRARIVEQIARILCGVSSPDDAEVVLVGD